MLGFLKGKGAINQYLVCPEQASKSQASLNLTKLVFSVLKFRLKKPEGKLPGARTAEERYQKVHSESHIINLARKFLNPPDLAEFLQKFKIKAKPQ